jgi:hypothetical protein
MTSTEETPIITDHARVRCAQMGISTKVAKRIWQQRTLVRGQATHDNLIVKSAEVPGYVIVVDEHGWGEADQRPVVVTVLFDTQEDVVRDGASYRVVS